MNEDDCHSFLDASDPAVFQTYFTLFLYFGIGSKALQANAKLLAFLQGNGITSMQNLYEKISVMNQNYYDLRGRIVSTERRLAVLNERLEIWTQYQQYKPIRQKLDKLKPRKREQYQ